MAASRSRRLQSLPNLGIIFVFILFTLWMGWFHFDQFIRASSLFRASAVRDAERNSTIQIALNRLTALKDAIEASERKLQNWEQMGSYLKQKVESLEASTTILSQHLSESVSFLPLKDVNLYGKGMNGEHGFMSVIKGRGNIQGPPEFFEFPSNISGDRILCFQGNDTSDGARNSYAYAYKNALPNGHVWLPGTTLISDSHYDFTNPWHSMYNLIQFVQWKIDNKCADVARLLVYHWGELRPKLGYWISNVFQSAGLPTIPERLSYDRKPVCFEHAVVSRIGIGGVPGDDLAKLYGQVRCMARRRCNLPAPNTGHDFHVTLLVRNGARGFTNVSDWMQVIKSECQIVKGCQWSAVEVSTLDFCQQVEVMGRTRVLISAHGAQLTNMIFMNPGSRVLEVFPRGWLELAGHGQYIYGVLSLWNALKHEGYWRDTNTPDCPTPNDPNTCFSFYKDQSIGINATFIGDWLAKVLQDVVHTQHLGDENLLRTNAGDSCNC